MVHVLLVVSVACQPLDLNETPGAYRSPIWSLHNDTIHRVGPGADFFAVYHAGRTLETGLDPYADVEHPPVTPYWFPFRYLPLVGQTLGRLATHFPPRTAYLLWLAVVESTLWLLLAVFVRRCSAPWLRTFSFAVLMLSSPYFLELHMGQFTFVALAATALALLLVEARGRIARNSGAVAYAVAAALKLFPLACVPALVRDRRHWPALVLAAALVLGPAVPYFAAHPLQERAFLELNFSPPVYGMDAGNVGFVYLLRLLTEGLGPGWRAEYLDSIMEAWRWILLGGTGLAVIFKRGSEPAIGVAALLLAHFVSYVHVWEHHASGIIIVGLLLLWGMQRKAGGLRTGNRVALLSAAAAVVVLALPTPFWFFDALKDPTVWDPLADRALVVRCAVAGSKAVPVVVLFAVALREVLREGRPKHGLSERAVGSGRAS